MPCGPISWWMGNCFSPRVGVIRFSPRGRAMRLRCCCGARAPPPRQVADCRFRTEGKVRAMHPEFGMGVEFASKTKDHRRLMEAVIRRLTLSHDPSPGCWLSRKDLIGEIEAKSCRKIHPFPQHGNRKSWKILYWGCSVLEPRCLAWIIQQGSSQKRKDALKGMMNTGFADPAFPFGASIT